MMRRAVAGPTPFTAPEERYFSMAAVVAGRARSKVSALNWSPKEGWLCQVPYTRSSSPSLTKGNIPTTVTTPASVAKSSTVYWFLSL